MAAQRYGGLKLGIAGATAASLLLGMGYFQSQGIAGSTASLSGASTVSSSGTSLTSSSNQTTQSVVSTTSRARTTRGS